MTKAIIISIVLWLTLFLGCSSSGEKENEEETLISGDPSDDRTSDVPAQQVEEQPVETAYRVDTAKGLLVFELGPKAATVTLPLKAIADPETVRVNQLTRATYTANLDRLGLPLEMPVAATVFGAVQLELSAKATDFSKGDLDISLPAGALPANGLPSNAMPASAIPANALPSSAIPANALPSSALPSAVVPEGSSPASAFDQALFLVAPRFLYAEPVQETPKADQVVVFALMTLSTIENEHYVQHCTITSALSRATAIGIDLRCSIEGSFPHSEINLVVGACKAEDYYKVRIGGVSAAWLRHGLDRKAVNHTPRFEFASGYELLVGKSTTLTLQPTDEDDDQLLAEVVGMPEFGRRDHELLVFTPTEKDLGTVAELTVTVRDNGHPIRSVKRTTTLVVVAAAGEWHRYLEPPLPPEVSSDPSSGDPSDDPSADPSDPDPTSDPGTVEPSDDPLPLAAPILFGTAEPLLRHWYDESTCIALFAELEALGSKRHREWVGFVDLLEDENTVKTDAKTMLDRVLAQATAHGIEILAVEDGSWPEWMTGVAPGVKPYPLPPRSTDPSSDWQLFLGRYEQAWTTLAETFPGIDHWEIGNEVNFNVYFYPEGYTDASNDPVFTQEEKVTMYADMLGRAAAAIRSVGPEDTIVLAGLTWANQAYVVDPEVYLEALYTEIEAREDDPDDYFDQVGLHVYLNEAPEVTSYVDLVELVQEVMELHGESEKTIALTEIGFSEELATYEDLDDDFSQDAIGTYLEDIFELTLRHLPRIETIYWFRLLDDPSQSDEYERTFGLLHSAEHQEPYSWKPQAQAYRHAVDTMVDSSAD